MADALKRLLDVHYANNEINTHFPARFLRFQVGALRVKTSIQIISQHGVSLTAIKLQVRGIYALNNTGSRCLEGV